MKCGEVPKITVRTTMFDPEPEPPKIHFRVVGIVANPEFQMCRCYVERLYKSFPNDYAEPEIRPVLDVEWHLFITKIRRKIGGEKLWALQKPVAVFIDGEFFGDDSDLLKFVATKYKLTISKDFEKIGKHRLIERLNKQSELGRNFVYFTIAVDDRVIGSMLFQIYTDLVPLISEIFMKRCNRKHGGYAGTPVQRIVIPSWIQCGGWSLKHRKVPCENYVVPHDQRGVLSMCHNGKHTDNSTQFFITLDPTPWMDYKYVAFGQLIQGEHVLRILEKIPTHYEAPTKKIQIVKCGEFTFYPTPDRKEMVELERFLATKDLATDLHEDIIDPRDAESVLLRRRYKRGLYCVATDLQSYLPFLHLPEYLIYKYLAEQKLLEAGAPEECYVEEKPKKMHPLRKKSAHFSVAFDETKSDERFIKGLLSDIIVKAVDTSLENAVVTSLENPVVTSLENPVVTFLENAGSYDYIAE